MVYLSPEDHLVWVCGMVLTSWGLAYAEKSWGRATIGAGLMIALSVFVRIGG